MRYLAITFALLVIVGAFVFIYEIHRKALSRFQLNNPITLFHLL